MNRLVTTASLMALLLVSGVAVAKGVKAQTPPATPPAVASSAFDRAPWWMRSSVITQTGSVYTEVQANRANFSATFLSVDQTADKAQAKSIQQTKALNQALGKLGKDAVRVTTGFSMRALYEQYRDKNGNRIEDQRGDKINGYEVSLNMSIEVRDMAQLEKAYALVLAASPTQTGNISFSLQPSNETNTWLYNEAIKDARKRAADGAVAAGGKLGGIKVIDPTGRACQTDILARGAYDSYDSTDAMEVPPPPVVQPRVTPPVDMAPPAPLALSAREGTAEYLEAKALANPFIQTPPLQRLEATACVVYGID